MKRILLIAGLLLVLAGVARAQGELLLQRTVVGGGGQVQTRSGLRLDYTVGQALAGPVWMGRVEVRSGYWPASPHTIVLPVILRDARP